MTKKAVGIISLIFAVIITVVFIGIATRVIGGITSNIVWAKGAIIDPADVVCFGGGDDYQLHCIHKEDGLGAFTVTAARAWQWKLAGMGGAALYAPALTQEGDVYFALGNHILSYNKEGTPNWDPNAQPEYSDIISTGVAAESGISCFGEIDEFHCLKQDGSPLRLDAPLVGGPTLSTPAIKGGFIYGAVGKYLYKWQTSGQLEQISVEFPKPIATGIEIGSGLVCFGDGDGKTVRCLDDENIKVEPFAKRAGNWQFTKALLKPAIAGNAVYIGFGNKVCKYDTTGKMQWPACWTGSKQIETDITVGSGLVCFGGGKDKTVHCLSAANGEQLFSVVAGDWDVKNAESTPFISGGIVYLGLGDKVCAYPAATRGNKNCGISACSSTKECNEIGCPGANWCADFDKVATDIVGLSETIQKPA